MKSRRTEFWKPLLYFMDEGPGLVEQSGMFKIMLLVADLDSQLCL